MNKKFNILDKFSDVETDVLANTIGGNYWSQARDTAWGFIDGINGHKRTSTKKRHRS